MMNEYEIAKTTDAFPQQAVVIGADAHEHDVVLLCLNLVINYPSCTRYLKNVCLYDLYTKHLLIVDLLWPCLLIVPCWQHIR